MKIFLPALYILLLCGYTSFGQPYMSKTLRQPHFFIIGIDSPSFPTRQPVPWSDTTESIRYGNRIMDWLQINHPAIDTSGSNTNLYSYHDFSKLNAEQIQRFKLVEKQLSYVLQPQKKVLMNKFSQANTSVKGYTPNFYYDYTQIYFLHKKDIQYIRTMIYN